MQERARAITKWRPLGLKKPHLAGSLCMSNTIGARLTQATLLDRFGKLSIRRSSIRVPRLVFGQQVSLCKDGAHCFMRYVRQRHEGVAWFAAVVAAEGHRRFKAGNTKAGRNRGVRRHEPVLKCARLIDLAALEVLKELHALSWRQVRQRGHTAGGADTK